MEQTTSDIIEQPTAGDQNNIPEGDQQPDPPKKKLWQYLNKNEIYTKPFEDFDKQFNNTDQVKKLHHYLDSEQVYTKGEDSFFNQFFPDQKPAPEHQIQHTSLQDIRHLNDLATSPDYVPEANATPGGFSVDIHQDEKKQAKEQAKNALSNQTNQLGQQWGVDPKVAKKSILDFPDENNEDKVKSYAQLYKENPVSYGMIKADNDIRMAIAKKGNDGVHDANIYNSLQHSENYDQLQQNIGVQQELMSKHGLGQEYWDKMQQAKAPLINTLDLGLLHQYWNSNDHKLGLSDFQYAGLETLKMFHPDQYKEYLNIIRENKGIDEGGNPLPEGQGKKGYEYDRGVENVLFSLERQGRENTAKYIAQHAVEVNKQMQALADEYKAKVKAAPDQTEQKRLIAEFNANPLIEESNRLDEGQQAIEYAQSEDKRKFPLNYSDVSTKLVKDAMDGTTGLMGNTGKFFGTILTGAGETSDNTLRFIKNTYINLLGSEQAKATQHAKNIGHQSLTELANYEPESYTGTQSPLLIPDDIKKSVQDIMNDTGLSDSEKEQKATNLVLENSDKIKINPQAGQQNITGKSALFTAANTLGQIVGIADQSLLMGGVLGNATKGRQMINALVPMYASTQNQLYEQALVRGDEKPLLKSNIDAAIVSLASLINPDFKIVKGMVGAETGLGKLIAGVDEATWNKVLSENSPIVNKMIAGTKATARQLGLANLQYGLIAPTAQYLAHKNILNENPNLGDMILDGMKQATISMALPALTHGIWGGVRASQVNPQQKYAIIEAGLHPQENIDLINGQLERGQIMPSEAEKIKEVIKHTGEILKNGEFVKTDGTPMNEAEVSDVVYNQLRKKVLEGKLRNAADPNKPLVEAKIHEVNQDISDLHTSDADKQKTELNKLLTDNLERIKEKMPTFEGPVKEAIAQNRPEDVFKEIASQALETTKKDGEEVSSRPLTEEIFGKELVAKAIELYKNKPEKPANIVPESKSVSVLMPGEIKKPEAITIKPQENAKNVYGHTGQIDVGGEVGESGQVGGGGHIQQASEQPSVDAQIEQPPGQVSGPPGQEVDPNALPFGSSSEIGISHERQQERAYDVKLTPPERGAGIELEQSIQRGRDLINAGTDPQKVADEFHRTNRLSWEDMSVVRAQNEINAKATHEAIDKFGEDSPEAKAAVHKEDEWLKTTVKPMQTEWSKIGVAQQGATDIDTGSVSSIRRAFKDASGRDFNTEEAKKAKELAEKVTVLSDKEKKLQDKIDKLMGENKELKEGKSIKESAKVLADKIRKGKTNRPDMFSAATPASLVWDAAVEIVASTVEAGGALADAIGKGLDHIRESDWYKGLKEDEKTTAEQTFAEWHNDAAQPEKNIAEKYVNKKGNKFTSDEAREIWEYTKSHYLDKKVELPDAIKGVATDLGLTGEQVINAIGTPKGVKVVSKELFTTQYDRRKAINSAKYFIANADKSKLSKAINKIPSIFFNLKTWGHGTVGNITHSGPNIFRPSTWAAYWPNVFKSFGLAYGSTANYEKAITILKSSPHFDEWLQAGLAADPNKIYDEYQLMGKPKKNTKTGQAIQWLNETGTRGFSGLNFMRYDMAEMLYNKASEAAKSDPELRSYIAQLVNHATGHSEVKVPKVIKVLTFAPGLEISRWQRMITDPVKAGKTFVNWDKSSPAEQAAAKITAASAGEKLAIYGALLAANAGLLAALGSKQHVNMNDPTKSDWMRFKFGGKTLDVTGNVLSPYRLLSVILGEAYKANTAEASDLKKKPADKQSETVMRQLRYKASPVAGTVTDILTATDPMGNVLPWSNVKPDKGRRKLTWKEFISQESLPIPVNAGLEAYWESMRERGVPESTAGSIFKGLLLFGTEGLTGAKLQEDFSLKKEEESGSKSRTTARAK